MVDIKHCPNCGAEIDGGDVEFCTECGYKLSKPIYEVQSNSNGFFDGLAEKTSFPVIAFSFIIFGIFLFVGSFIWASFMASGSIDLITYLLLTIVFSVFFGGIFVGYFGCKEKSYVLPNFSMYLGSVFAVVLCGIGLIFTFLMGILSVVTSALSSAFPSSSTAYTSGSSFQPTVPNFTPSVDFSFIFKIILFILLIPVAAYFGVYLGYILKENI